MGQKWKETEFHYNYKAIAVIHGSLDYIGDGGQFCDT